MTTRRTTLSDWANTAPRLVAAGGVAIISFTAILVSLADASPITISFFRPAYAVPVLLAIGLMTKALAGRSLRQRFLGFAAGLAFAGDLAFWHLSIENIGAGLATVLGNTQAVLVMIAGWLILRERPTRVAVAMVPVVIAGVVLISGLGQQGVQGDNPPLGVIFGLATAVFYTIFLMVLRHAGGSGTSPVAPLLEATFGAAVGGLLLSPLDPNFDLTPTWPTHGWLLLLAVGSQVIGWLLITYALPRLEAWETSVILVLQPAGTVMLAYVILSESFAGAQWLGVILVVTAVGVASASRRPTHAEPTVLTS